MSIIQRIIVPAGVVAGLLSLSACSGVKTTTPTVNNYEAGTVGTAPSGAGGLGTLFTFGKGAASSSNGPGSSIQVNAFLWRAALDTLSFMPMASADPFGGVIITDWYSPPSAPDTRFKANAYILSKTLTASAIQVSVFEQVLQGGQWVDTPADPAIANGLENRILARAADLQAAANHAGQ